MRKALPHCMLAAVLLSILPESNPVEAFVTAGFHEQESLQSQGMLTGTPTVIRVSSNLVTVPVSVTDAAGRPVDNLALSDFKIEEDDRPEQIAELAEPGRTPLELALLFDISGSVSPRFEFEQKAALHFLERVYQPGDMISIMAIAAEPLMVQEITGNLQTALNSLRNLSPTRGMTAFYDAVATSAHILRKSSTPDSRRVEVVISDGEDNNSQLYGLAAALREIQRSDCIFYAINPAGPSINLNRLSIRGHGDMQSLADGTGGRVFLPDGLSDLEAIFARILSELRAQYLLEYYSSNKRADGEFRRIVVTIPGRPDLRIRARQGYYAPMS
jgi:Ca-activated chloride channel family protein